MRIIKTSASYIDFVINYEGLKFKPYLCPANVPTIGIGSTLYKNGSRVRMTDSAITKEQAISLFNDTVSVYERAVDSFTRDDISQNQFDALVDFAYNVGVGALKSSTLLKKVNINPEDPLIRNEFKKWIYGGDGSKNGVDDNGNGIIDEIGEKQRLNGLVNRREAEANLYFKK